MNEFVPAAFIGRYYQFLKIYIIVALIPGTTVYQYDTIMYYLSQEHYPSATGTTSGNDFFKSLNMCCDDGTEVEV